MVWKNQESWEIGLDGFLGKRHPKKQKYFADKFFFALISAAIMNLWIVLKYFFFSNIIPRGVSTCKMPTF